METTNTIVKFSPGRELYPGTSSRVCIIIGAIPDICAALRRIMSLTTDSSHIKTDDIHEYLCNFKLLVSNIAAGMVIGKSGQTIRILQQQCGVKIQISNKEESSLPERTLTVISGSTEATEKAVKSILELIKDDPDAWKWKKLLSYSGYTAKSPVGSSQGHSYSHGHSPVVPAPNIATSPSAASLYASAADPSTAAASFLNMLQHPSYAAFSGGMPSQSAAGASYNQAALSYAYAQSLMANQSYSTHLNPVVVDGVNLMIPGATLATFEVAVPEVMVSSVAGPGGKLLTDLMQSTGARVQLSGKGDYFAGTYNRKLTIGGPILSVQAAHMVVLQKILKEQEVYRKQGLV